MKKLSDEKVAKALGWVEVRERKTSSGGMSLKGLHPKWLGKTPYNVPAYTTDLNAIVTEVECRDLDWLVQTSYGEDVGKASRFFAEVENAQNPGFGRTPALALCAALLAYLGRKEKGVGNGAA